MHQDTKILREGVHRIEAIAKDIDRQQYSSPSLFSTIENWANVSFFYVHDLDNRLEMALQSPEDASREGMGLIFRGLLQTIHAVVVEHKDNEDLNDKFHQLLNYIGPLSNLRSASNRDIWMDLCGGYNKHPKSVDVRKLAQWLVDTNALPQQCADKDRENLTDYLVRHTYTSFDDVFESLKELSHQWWETSLLNSRVFGPDSTTWGHDIKHLDASETKRAQMILDNYFLLTLKKEVESAVTLSDKSNRKAKI